MFYLSEYLEQHRLEYNSRLQAISAKKDWDGWTAFFLPAITEQAQQNIKKVSAIQDLYEQMKITFQQATRSQHAVHVLDAVFSKPIFRTVDLSQRLEEEYDIYPKTCAGLIRRLRSADLLVEVSPAAGSRPATLAFSTLINLVEGRKVF